MATFICPNESCAVETFEAEPRVEREGGDSELFIPATCPDCGSEGKLTLG